MTGEKLFLVMKVIFLQGQRSQYVRRSTGEEINESLIYQTVKHPDKKMFWGCFSYYEVWSLHLVEGMMNSDKYMYVLEQKVIPEMRKRFTDGSGVFQQDLAPCQTSKKVKSFMDENQIYVLQWPGNSPDLNPIENLRSIIKTRLENKDCTTKIKLIEAIIQLWYRDEQIQSDCKKLVDSMPKRVRDAIKRKGGHMY